MAQTLATSGLTPQAWDNRFFEEYVRQSRFNRYMGRSENAIIQVKENLAKQKGDRIVFSLVHSLQGAGVTGNTTLEGNEEALDSRSHQITVNVLRHAVTVTDFEEQKSAIGLRNAARSRLSIWAKRKLRDGIISALGSIDGVAYGSASAAQKNTWSDNNADRVLYGAAKANLVAGNHAASLANVDSAGDKLTTSMVSLAKRMAQEASPAIRPVVTKNETEWFVMYVPNRAFRDLRADAAMQQALREGWVRDQGDKNPLFTGDDMIWDGVIVKSVPEIGYIAGAGAAGIDVAACYLCGAQAVGLAWAQRTRTATQDTDYAFRHGVAVQEIRGVEKLRFGTGVTDTATLKDNGVVTVFVSGVADA